MTDIIPKLLERILLCVVCFVIPAIFFLLYQSSYKATATERITREFVDSISNNGIITRQEYEQYLSAIANIDDYTVEMMHTSYVKEPYYGYYSDLSLQDYYKNRNKKESHLLTSELPSVKVVDVDKLFLQKTTNASILAGSLEEGNIYIALPDEENVHEAQYTVMVPEQEMYVNEPIVTMLKIQQNGLTYFSYEIEDDMGNSITSISTPGNYIIPVTVNGTDTGKSLNLTVWDKTVTCNNNHTYPRTPEVIQHYKENGVWEKCPYCKAYVSDITLSPQTSTVQTGTPVEDITTSVKITYYDGHVETKALVDVLNDYCADYTGQQDIVISYNGFTKTAGSITTTNHSCTVCNGSISERSHSDYLDNPLCITCSQNTPIYLNEYVNTGSISTHTDIINKLLNDEKYCMKRGDYLSVSIYRNGQLMSNNVFPTSDMRTYFRIGEKIRRSAESN